MKISGGEINNLVRSYLQRPARVEQEGDRAQVARAGRRQGDELVLSPQAQEIQRLREALAQVPEARAERVRELASAIEAGTYQVPHEAVAMQMLRRLLGDQLL